jgi:hypothetical protein
VAPNKSKTAIHTNYQLHGHTLEIVDSNKYLGVNGISYIQLCYSTYKRFIRR